MVYKATLQSFKEINRYGDIYIPFLVNYLIENHLIPKMTF